MFVSFEMMVLAEQPMTRSSSMLLEIAGLRWVVFFGRRFV